MWLLRSSFAIILDSLSISNRLELLREKIATLVYIAWDKEVDVLDYDF
jgi:hypothetical protein